MKVTTPCCHCRERRKAGTVENIGLAIVVIGALVWMLDGTGRLWPYYLGGGLFGAGMILLDRAIPR